MGFFSIFKRTKRFSQTSNPDITVASDCQEDISSKTNDKDSVKQIVHSETNIHDNHYLQEPYIVTFEERKKTAVPSKRGLYPAEILLINYCSKSRYPLNRDEYPAYWWYEYGIKDVGAMLESLEMRGYITFGDLSTLDNKNVTAIQVKELLESKGLPNNGKRSEMIARAIAMIPKEELLKSGLRLKYIPTIMGQQELEENAYIPYMHAHSKTTESGPLEQQFNIWSINIQLGKGDKSNWQAVVKKHERDFKEQLNNNREQLIGINEEQPISNYFPVVTFEDRKKTAYPSKRGLYPPEILLIYFCSLRKYPLIEHESYPRFWWEEYGIKDVNAVLKSLEERGFIVLGDVRNINNKNITVNKLKALLSAHGFQLSGNKEELITRLLEMMSNEELINSGVFVKYKPTLIGEKELEENQYVAYMHSHGLKDEEGIPVKEQCNVWGINAQIGERIISDWKEIIPKRNAKWDRLLNEQFDELINEAREIHRNEPFIEDYIYAIKSEKQLIMTQEIMRRYREEEMSFEKYLAFWEHLWETDGLLFEGVRWYFELPDLYIQAHRYCDALKFLQIIIEIKPEYASKAEKYIRRIKELQVNQQNI
jgi:hypothetical protein